MINYKIDVMKELKIRGYPANRCRRERILSESTMQRLREKKPIGMDAINTICIILSCQPSDIFEIVPTADELNKYHRTDEQ